MSIQSPYAIQFTPRGGGMVELVPIDGWLVDHPRFDASQQLFELDGIKNQSGFFKPTGGATVVISFASDVDQDLIHPDFLEAENGNASSLLDVDGTLVFGGPDGVMIFPDAVITGLTPGLPYPAPSITREFSIIASLPTLP